MRYFKALHGSILLVLFLNLPSARAENPAPAWLPPGGPTAQATPVPPPPPVTSTTTIPSGVAPNVPSFPPPPAQNVALPPGGPPSPQGPPPPVEAPKPVEYGAHVESIAVSAGFGTGAYGNVIPASATFNSTGVETFKGKRLLIVWDADGGATFGYVGNQHPGMWFVGGKIKVDAQVGYRVIPSSAWSPYVGAGAKLAGSAVAIPGLPGPANTQNAFDGVDGVNGTAAVRAAFGVSNLQNLHSFLLTGFVQEALRAPVSIPKGAAYTEVGVQAQFDLQKNLSIAFTGTYGVTGQQNDPAFGAHDRSTYLEAELEVKKYIGKSFWLGVDAKVTQKRDKTVYDGSPITYDTSGPVSPYIGLTAGIALP